MNAAASAPAHDARVALPPDELLDVRQLAAIFRVQKVTIQKWATNGALPGVVRVGGILRFRRADIADLLAGRPAV